MSIFFSVSAIASLVRGLAAIWKDNTMVRIVEYQHQINKNTTVEKMTESSWIGNTQMVYYNNQEITTALELSFA